MFGKQNTYRNFTDGICAKKSGTGPDRLLFDRSLEFVYSSSENIRVDTRYHIQLVKVELYAVSGFHRKN
jgi:hypothetical protein